MWFNSQDLSFNGENVGFNAVCGTWVWFPGLELVPQLVILEGSSKAMWWHPRLWLYLERPESVNPFKYGVKRARSVWHLRSVGPGFDSLVQNQHHNLQCKLSIVKENSESLVHTNNKNEIENGSEVYCTVFFWFYNVIWMTILKRTFVETAQCRKYLAQIHVHRKHRPGQVLFVFEPHFQYNLGSGNLLH